MASIYPREITVGILPDLEYWRDFAALVEKHAGAFRADLEKLLAAEAQARSGAEGEGM
jgi:hypothetical protein